jgi:flagellar biosynthesis protein FlhF
MRLKSYFADSLQEAIEKARVDLGPEAMLVSSRQTSADLRDLGSYEVVFGVDGASAKKEPKPELPKLPEPAPAAVPAGDMVLRELAELRQQMETFARTLSRSQSARTTVELPPELARVLDRLVAAGFSEELAREIAEAAAAHVPRDRAAQPNSDLFSRELLRAAVEQELSTRFSVEPRLGEDGENSAVVMLVGPPGAGKTTSLVKLALNYGLKARRPIRLLSLDTLRIGGCDQLQRYARILGTALQQLDTPAALETAVLGNVQPGLSLIDTPGFAAADEPELRQLALAARHLPIDIHLVLPAYTRLDAAARIAQRFSSFHPTRLLITHMDASAGPATPIELAIRTALPLSFFGTGQQVPEDLKEADKAALLTELIPRERAASSAAA